MTIRSKGIRAFAVLVLMAGLLGAISRAAAQDVGDYDGESGASGPYVGVSCSYDGTTDLSSCAFTPATDVGVISSLFIPGAGVCTSIVDAGAAAWIDGGVVQSIAGDGITLTLSGIVSAGGSATYGAVIDDVSQDIAGDGLACGDSVNSSDVETEDPPVEVTQEATESVEESTPEVTAEPDDETVSNTEATPDAGSPEPSGDSTPDVAEDPVEDVTINVIAYDCTTDPGSGDPSVDPDCSVSVGVDISGTADSGDIGTQTTDGNGYASFTAPDGSAVELVEDGTTVPSGFHAIAGGTASLTASDGAWVTFVHLADAVAGRLQIVNGSCPTSGESRTEFRVIEPRTVSAASTPACGPTSGAEFTIVGGPYDGLVVTTGSDGAWRGYLPPAEYTIYDDSGASANVTVVANDTSVVIVVDYVAAPQGVLNLSRFVCEGSDQTNIVIEVQYAEPTIGDDDGCEPSDGEVTVEVLAEVSTSSVTTIQLGADGVEEIELPSGSYLITDQLSGEQASVDLKSGSRLYVVIEDLAVGGDGVGSGDPDGGGDGSGQPGGGSGDPGGNPGGGDPDTGSGGGDGTGTETDNGGTGATGGDDTSGGTDAGADDDQSSSDELASVTSLPVTGAAPMENNGNLLFGSLALLSAAALGFGISRRRKGDRTA